MQTVKREETGQEITESQEFPEAVQYVVDETSEVKECDTTNRDIEVHVKECDTTVRAIEVHFKEWDTADRAIEPHPITRKLPSSNGEAERIENLSAEVEKLKVMLLRPKFFHYSSHVGTSAIQFHFIFAASRFFI